MARQFAWECRAFVHTKRKRIAAILEGCFCSNFGYVETLDLECALADLQLVEKFQAL